MHSLPFATLQELLEYANGQHSFTMVVEDPSGNSFIGDPGSADAFSREAEDGNAAAAAAAAAGAGPEPRDHMLTVERIRRSAAQSERLGLDPDAEPFVTVQGPPTAKLLAKFGEQGGSSSDARRADGACASCGTTVTGRVHVPAQPFIPDTELLEMTCGACGLPSVEVRRTAGARVPTGGQRLCLRVEAPEDLRRMVLASASASLSVPELDLAFSGTEDGMFSSVGRLLSSILGGLINTRGMLPEAESEGGDSQVTAAQREWQAFAADAEAMLSLERSWTLVLSDPRSGSFISPLQGGADDRLTVSELMQVEEGRGPAGSAA